MTPAGETGRPLRDVLIAFAAGGLFGAGLAVAYAYGGDCLRWRLCGEQFHADWIGSTSEDAMTDQKGATMVGRFYGEDGVPVIGMHCLDDASLMVGVVTGPYNDAAKYKPISIDIRVDKEKPMSFLGSPENNAGFVSYQAYWTPKSKSLNLVDLVRYIGLARERVVLGLPTHTFIMEVIGDTAKVAENMIKTCHLPGGDIEVPDEQRPIPVMPTTRANLP